jgi:hypothetical protein
VNAQPRTRHYGTELVSTKERTIKYQMVSVEILRKITNGDVIEHDGLESYLRWWKGKWMAAAAGET